MLSYIQATKVHLVVEKQLLADAAAKDLNLRALGVSLVLLLESGIIAKHGSSDFPTATELHAVLSELDRAAQGGLLYFAFRGEVAPCIWHAVSANLDVHDISSTF